MQVQANELRIGNIVGRIYANPNPNNITKEVEPCFVKSIKESTVNITLSLKDKAILSKYPIDKIQPIPLTEEWLLKFGFKVNENGARININVSDEFCIYFTENIFRYQTQSSGFTRQLRHIKYVHQLQNLYFALTGEELTFNK